MPRLPPPAELRTLLVGDVSIVFTLAFTSALAETLDTSGLQTLFTPLEIPHGLNSVLADASCIASCWLISGAPARAWARDAIASPGSAVAKVWRSWIGAANARIAVAVLQAAVFGRDAVDPVAVLVSVAWLLPAMAVWRAAAAAALSR
jgi:hypothetical protein